MMTHDDPPPRPEDSPDDDIDALRESEARFRQLAEHIRAVFYMLDPRSGYLLYVSPAFNEVWGRDADEVRIIDTVVDEDRSIMTAARERQGRGEATEVQYRILRPTGEIRWVLDRAFPVRENGELARTVGIAEDITDDKHREQRQHFLAEASRLLSSTLSFAETLNRITRLVVPRVADWCSIYLPDESGALVPIDFAHSSRDKIELARELHRMYPPLPTEKSGVYAVYRTGISQHVREVNDELLAEWSRDDMNLRILRGLGLRSHMAVPLIARGVTLGVMTFASAESGRVYDESDVVFAEDLAARAAVAADNARLFEGMHRARGEAERKHAELQAVNESRTRLMRGFSHDLKNPLGAADGHASLLEDGLLGDLSEQQRHSVARIRNGIRHAVALINDLVELARAESGQIALRPHPLDVRDVVKELIEQHRPDAEQAGLSISRTLGEVPVIHADGDRVGQILGNLLSNAVKYTPAGGSVEVRTGMRAGPIPLGDEPVVAIDVVDTGIGIPEDKLAVLFTEFERIDPSVRPGAGLGLAISRRIARLLGGDITVATSRGEGSQFTLWLPVTPVGPE